MVALQHLLVKSCDMVTDVMIKWNVDPKGMEKWHKRFADGDSEVSADGLNDVDGF